MKVKFELEQGYPYIVIKYEGDEWTKIENILKSLGLKKSITERGFGKDLRLEYYRESNTELLNYLRNYFNSKISHVIDNINDYVYTPDGRFNIAIFRVVPNQNNEVKILLDKYLTVYELKQIFEKIGEVYEALLNIALEAEANFNVQEEK